MSKSLIGIILIIIGSIAYYFFTAEFETPYVWYYDLNSKILSEPVEVNGNYVFWGGNKGKNIYKLFLINSTGKKAAESQVLPHMPFDPIVIGDKIIMSDHARMLRAFSATDLKPVWEVAANEKIEHSPVKYGSNVLQCSGKTIYCLNSETGKILWDVTSVDGLKNFGCDKIVVVIHGYKDVSKPVWKCSAYDEDGYNIWNLQENVSKEKPIFVQNTCVLTTAEGEVVVLDQLSGEILFRSGAKGFIAIKAFSEGVLLVNKEYTTFAYLSFVTGESWTHSLKVDFMGAAEIDSHIIIADKKTLRCFDKNSGILEWQRDLGDVYGAFPYKKGIFVNYKNSFESRTLYGICLSVDSPKNLWLAKGTSVFRKPCSLDIGDLLLGYDGGVRLLPKANLDEVIKQESVASSTSSIAKQLKDVYEAKKAKGTQENKGTKSATSNQKITNKKTTQLLNQNKNKNQAIPSDLYQVKDEDAGW